MLEKGYRSHKARAGYVSLRAGSVPLRAVNVFFRASQREVRAVSVLFRAGYVSLRTGSVSLRARLCDVRASNVSIREVRVLLVGQEVINVGSKNDKRLWSLKPQALATNYCKLFTLRTFVSM